MRISKLAFFLLVTAILSASPAAASSVDVIWQISGTVTTIAVTNGSVVADVVLTIGASDTPLGGFGAGYELSADYTYPGLAITGSTNPAPGGGVPLVTGPDDGVGHFENILAAAYFGGVFAAGTSTVIGTVTVHVGGAGGVLAVGPSGPNDDLVNPGGISLLSEFTFHPGILMPEPTTGSLLALGLIGMSAIRRRDR